MEAISREEALKLCEEVRRKNRHKWYSATRWQCWGCVTFTRGELDKMCLRTETGYNGCPQINQRYASQ